MLEITLATHKEIHTIPTYVDEVALTVQHDVAVVSVFYLQQEEQQAVSCHAADEVVPCLKRNMLDGISDCEQG